MVQSISKIVLRSRIKKTSLMRKKNFLPWEKISKIALILEPETNFSKYDIDTVIDQSQKVIEVFYIELKSKQATYSDWNCYTKKHKSIFGLPLKLIEQNMLGKKFDLIINTCSPNNLFAISLSNSAQATLNCGPDKTYNEADFIVTRANGQSLVDYLKNIVSYLKMIKTE